MELRSSLHPSHPASHCLSPPPLCPAPVCPAPVCPAPVCPAPFALQSCYGIMELPGPDQMWLCSACEQKEEGKAAPQVGAGAGRAGRQEAEDGGCGRGVQQEHRQTPDPATIALEAVENARSFLGSLLPSPCSAACAPWWAAPSSPPTCGGCGATPHACSGSQRWVGGWVAAQAVQTAGRLAHASCLISFQSSAYAFSSFDCHHPPPPPPACLPARRSRCLMCWPRSRLRGSAASPRSAGT